MHLNQQKISKYRVYATSVPKSREHSLDILRGIAVFLMILSHAIYFLHDGSNNILHSIQNFGDTVAFTTFLLVSGAVIYINYQRKKNDFKNLKLSILKRIIILLICYYIIAFISALKLDNLSQATLGQLIIDILILKKIPGFTEFLIVFIVYSFIYFLWPKTVVKLGKKTWRGILIGLIIYLIGYGLYFIEIPEPINFYKSIFAGDKILFISEGFYRFPLLQYFIVFIIGISLGRFLYHEINIQKRKKIAFLAMLYLLFAITLTLIIKPYENFSEFNDFERWPPTIPFIVLGLFFSFTVLLFILKRSSVHLQPKLYKILTALGQNAFMYFMIHLCILQIYDKFICKKFDSWIISLSLVIVLFFITILSGNMLNIILNKKQKLDSNQQDFMIKEGKKTKTNIIIAMLLIITIVTLGVIVKKNSTPNDGYVKRTGQVQGTIYTKREDTQTRWWNYDYSFQKRISIYNQALFSPIYKDSWVSFEIDHASLIAQNKASHNGNDLRVVYFHNDSFSEIPYVIHNKGSSTTKLYFRLITDIPTAKYDRNYYLYYGNKLAANPPLEIRIPSHQAEAAKTIISKEIAGLISISVNHYWILKDENVGQSEDLEITMKVNSNNFATSQDVKYTYQIIGTNLFGKLFETNSRAYQATINISTLKPGIYQIQAKGEAVGIEILSPKESFVVSYPLYVTWSIDWEGYDVKDEFLSSMEKISSQYGIPISHFFNPRIYIGIPSDRATKLTEWIKNRKNKGDSIDMHMHMFVDMVKAADVDPYNTGGVDINGNSITKAPRQQWGTNLQGGYDILISSFNYDELTKILAWGIHQFQNNGLDKPKGFRAGGWFADLENLAAIEDAGFLYDSSGRTAFSWGNNKVSGPWNLQSTTQPYRPSRTDQNSPNPPPNFGIWEFPNNGADSGSYTAEEMIQRFTDNYENGVLREKKLVTFLSHPHWFNYDEPRLNILFTHINKFLYKNDNGPVIYINLNKAYEAWTYS